MEQEGEDDVRIMTKRLVKFRLCPSAYCDNNKGCSNGYGDYVIDMETFMYAWMESKATYQSFKCDYLKTNVCICEDDNENYAQDMCLYDCYQSHGMGGLCMDYNPYGDGGVSNNAFSISDYMTCTQIAANANQYVNEQQEQQGGQRRLADQEQAQDWDGSYYVGPYCASQGGAIFLGMFTDDSCTTFADSAGGRETYFYTMGSNLPYSTTNVVDMDCLSCKEPTDNNVDGNDADDTDDVTEACENIYTIAGKCEANLPYGTVYAPNNNACNYIEGIKIVRKDGTVISAQAKANKTASVFIGVFTVSFVLLSAYVYFLKTKLDRASINLSE
jgi:hypothetical protein